MATPPAAARSVVLAVALASALATFSASASAATHEESAAAPALGSTAGGPARSAETAVRTTLDRRLARRAVQEPRAKRVPDDDPRDARYDERELPALPAAAPRRAAPRSAGSFGPNVRISTPFAPAGVGESEVTIAAIGDRLVAGWNDGLVFGSQPGFVGYGYSTDGGVTWLDGGSLPVAGALDVYYGDPVVVADPAGHWYFADLYRATPGETGISVNHGTFAGDAPAWDLPAVLATSASDLLDKPWLAVDAMDGTVYAAYVRFFAGGQHIEFSRSQDHGVNWSTPIAVTDAATTSTMSPRLVVGPDHELYLLYYSSQHGNGFEYLKLRSSANHGQTWGPERIVASRPYANNFYAGPAGYNRERVVALVSADVDRSAGTSRGRLHVVWHEMQDVYADLIGGAGPVPEVEPNDVAASATLFVPGAELRGSLASTTEQDWWSFAGVAGQTMLFQLLPRGSSCDGFLRMFAGGGTAANRCALSHFSGGVGAIVFTLPSTATYYLRVLNWDGLPSSIGDYSVYTGVHTPVPTDLARDHRDVIHSSSSDGGVDWSTPVVLSDAAPHFDETFPEVAVDAEGRVYVMWYDHRLDPANGILTTMQVRQSLNGGASWLPSVRIDDGPAVNWNLVASNMFPNMGDYSQVVADGGDVHAIWADGREGTPDPYYARLVSSSVSVPPTPAARLSVRGLGAGPGGSVRARVVAASGPANVELFDVSGRRLASAELAAGGARDVELGHGLASGIYLLRVRQRGESASARVAALR